MSEDAQKVKETYAECLKTADAVAADWRAIANANKDKLDALRVAAQAVVDKHMQDEDTTEAIDALEFLLAEIDFAEAG